MPPNATPLPPTRSVVPRRGLAGDLPGVAALAALALALGLTFNFLRASSLPLVYASPAERLDRSVARLATDHLSVDPPTASPGLTEAPPLVDLDRFHALTEDPAGVVLDARPGLFFKVGHVPGAHPLSREKFEADYAALRGTLETRRESTLAVYCAGGNCEDSRLVAAALRRLGYTHVVIYEGGWEEWQGAGLPEERS